jgi:simple sugar transport system ATP-binding protein
VTRTLSSYSVAVQQMVAIARALSVEAKVLILDEPTSSLDTGEVQRLFDVLRRLRDEGLAILFVTHFLEQVYAISDRITVLRNGTLVGEYPVAQLGPKALIAAMVGRELAEGQSVNPVPDDQRERVPVVSTTALSQRGQLQPIDIELCAGEVVGLGGLLGSGRTELARLLFGLASPDGGEVRVRGQAARITNPAEAVRHGLALCPEDRKTDGIVAARTSSWRCRPVPGCAAACRTRSRRRWPRSTSRHSASRPTTWKPPSGCCRAATSKRHCSPAGSPPTRRC